MSDLNLLVNGRESFSGGHQFIRIRKPNRKPPSWAASEEGIQRVLLAAFPNLKTNYAQRDQAARWAWAIQLYFKAYKSCQETAAEMGEKPSTIHALIRRIKRVAAGKTARGRKRVKSGPGRLTGSKNQPKLLPEPETKLLQISQSRNQKRADPTGARRVARLRRRRFLARLLERMETILKCPGLPEDLRIELDSDLKTVWRVKQVLDSGRDVPKISKAQDRAVSRKIDVIYRCYIHT
jgi:hypothetical protein